MREGRGGIIFQENEHSFYMHVGGCRVRIVNSFSASLSRYDLFIDFKMSFMN